VNRKVLAIVLTIFATGSLGAFTLKAQAPGGKPEPFIKYKFLVEIDGITEAHFMEVAGLNVTVDVVEFREGGDSLAPILLPGLAHYGPLVLRHGLEANQELLTWMEDTVDGDVSRRNLSVVIFDPEGNEVARFNCHEAWPSSWRLGALTSLGVGPVVEELVIQYEKFEWVSYD
jgi:phage tail-like protein